MKPITDEARTGLNALSDVSYYAARDALTADQIRQWHRDNLATEHEHGGSAMVMMACSPGCSWCCNQAVAVMPVEVVLIVDQVKDWRRVLHSAEIVRTMKNVDRERQRKPCGLLGDDNRCSIYESRPGSCRSVHSISAETCETRGGQQHYLPELYALPKAHLYGAARAFEERGLDCVPVELSVALAHIEEMKPGEALERWLAGERLFPESLRIKYEQKGSLVKIRVGKRFI